ncbi:hypothetical protein ACHAWF_004801 [Thalassiosira exigua]
MNGGAATTASFASLPAAVLLLLAAVAGTSSHAFAPSSPATAARGGVGVAKLVRPRLGYVRGEDDLAWPRGRDDRSTGIVPAEELLGDGYDYEARIERRFSRHKRRERLRSISDADLAERRRREERRRRPRPPPPLLSGAPIPIVNFRTNADYPWSHLPSSARVAVARPPGTFDPPAWSPCARASTAALVPLAPGDLGPADGRVVVLDGAMYAVEGVEDAIVPAGDGRGGPPERAYRLEDELRGAIYGRVRRGTTLRRLDPPLMVPDLGGGEGWTSVGWIATDERVAVKEMSWEHIRTHGPELAEDPIGEVASMQHLSRWADEEGRRREAVRTLRRIGAGGEEDEEGYCDDEESRHSHHVAMPLDLLSDDEHLFSVTPFCAGGRLLDVLESKGRFSEPEARRWMRQILAGLSCLKRAGVVHRDMSPENLMVHGGNLYVIDFGMSLRIPYDDNDEGDYDVDEDMLGGTRPRGRRRRERSGRSLILPQSPCGKWYYLSPEVLLSEEPFDGPAVDLWAAGVILYVMLVGTPPWEEPREDDENFRLMSSGHVRQMMKERRAGLSEDATDLLQRMFWRDPADRLSLEQVLAHPWIAHGDVGPPFLAP